MDDEEGEEDEECGMTLFLTDTFSRATTLPRSESHLRAYKAHAMNLSRWAILS